MRQHSHGIHLSSSSLQNLNGDLLSSKKIRHTRQKRKTWELPFWRERKITDPTTHDTHNNYLTPSPSTLSNLSASSTMSSTGLTTSLIPCCTCGAIIAPNPSNQCASCLATIDISSVLRRGPGGGDLIFHQCRQCRKYDRGGDGRYFLHLEPESPELMAVLLKQVPALSGKGQQSMRRSHGVESLQLLDSMFIWTVSAAALNT